MSELHQLAFLLTLDPEEAIHCVASALAECVHGKAIPAQYGDFWAHRMVAKYGIAAALEPEGWLTSRWWDSAEVALPYESCEPDSDSLADMDPLERIVIVLCTTGGYSIYECADLIATTAKEFGDVDTDWLANFSAEPTVAIAA